VYKPKIYTASKLRHYQLWQVLRKDPDWDFAEWTATWPQASNVANELAGEPVSEQEYCEAWMGNVNEVLNSDFVLLYKELTDKLRGALVECGVALGAGIPVCAVGLSLEHTWRHHKQVKCFDTLREARLYLYKYTVAVPPNSRKRREPNGD